MAKNGDKILKVGRTISIISHQLKTPLSAIKGYIEALTCEDCGKINPLQKEYLCDAMENVEKMYNFIENLLEVTRIEEGEFEMVSKNVSLDEIIENILAEIALWLKASNCQVNFKKPKNLSKVFTDKGKTYRTIYNLINNAALYKEGMGKIEIVLEEKGKQIVFSCKDNGVGIPISDFKKVFTKFYRSEDAVELNPSGSGLGLYIGKKVVELSGGKMWFSKNKGKGMTFYLSLPTAK